MSLHFHFDPQWGSVARSVAPETLWIPTEAGTHLVSEAFADSPKGVEHGPAAVGSGSNVVEVFAIPIVMANVQFVQRSAAPKSQFLAEVRVN